MECSLLLWSLWDFAPCHTEELDAATLLWVNEAVSNGLNILLLVGKISLLSGKDSCLRGKSGFLGLDNGILGNESLNLGIEIILLGLELSLFVITLVLGCLVGIFVSLLLISLCSESYNLSRSGSNFYIFCGFVFLALCCKVILCLG